jgi:hypothetical protein
LVRAQNPGQRTAAAPETMKFQMNPKRTKTALEDLKKLKDVNFTFSPDEMPKILVLPMDMAEEQTRIAATAARTRARDLETMADQKNHKLIVCFRVLELILNWNASRICFSCGRRAGGRYSMYRSVAPKLIYFSFGIVNYGKIYRRCELPTNGIKHKCITKFANYTEFSISMKKPQMSRIWGEGVKSAKKKLVFRCTLKEITETFNT